MTAVDENKQDRPPLCKQCSQEPSTTALNARNGQTLCASCFQAFVVAKIFKRMSPFQPRHWLSVPVQTLLLPTSLGHSSLALLQILTRLLERQQERVKRTAYVLHVLHVECSLDKPRFNRAQERLRQIQELYPAHTYSQISVSSIYDAPKGPEQNGAYPIENNDLPEQRLTKLLQALSSPTSRMDVMGNLLTRSVINFAIAHSCDAILWADSISRLSERVMSETAKGRGFSLPWRVSDGETPYGIPFSFPNGDVFRSELTTYLTMADASLAGLVEEAVSTTSSPNTMDTILRNYFSSAEASHPGLLSNVVRTSSKMEPKEVGMLRCKLCIAPVTNAQMGIEGWKGIQNTSNITERYEYGLCYGCSRSVPKDAVGLLP